MNVKALPKNTYFIPQGCYTPFLYDNEGRFTRLWDGCYVDGFFEKNEKVEVISYEQAVNKVKEFRNLVALS